MKDSEEQMNQQTNAHGAQGPSFSTMASHPLSPPHLPQLTAWLRQSPGVFH